MKNNYYVELNTHAARAVYSREYQPVAEYGVGQPQVGCLYPMGAVLYTPAIHSEGSRMVRRQVVYAHPDGRIPMLPQDTPSYLYEHVREVLMNEQTISDVNGLEKVRLFGQKSLELSLALDEAISPSDLRDCVIDRIAELETGQAGETMYGHFALASLYVCASVLRTHIATEQSQRHLRLVA